LVVSCYLFVASVGAQNAVVPFKAKFIERTVTLEGIDRSYKEKIVFRNSDGAIYQATNEMDPTTRKIISSLIQIQSLRDSTAYLLDKDRKIAHTLPISQRPDSNLSAAILKRKSQSGLTTRAFLGRRCYVVPLRRNGRVAGEVFQDVETGFYLYMEALNSDGGKDVTEAVEFTTQEAEAQFFEAPDLSGYRVNP